jgi:hypothetical protein
MAFVVNPVVPLVEYVATLGQTVFSYGFAIFEDADLVVQRDGAIKTLGVDYTVTGAGTTAGGTVVFLSGLGSGAVVKITRSVEIKRQTDFPTSGPFNVEQLNDELDRITMSLQEFATLPDLAASIVEDAATQAATAVTAANSAFTSSQLANTQANNASQSAAAAAASAAAVLPNNFDAARNYIVNGAFQVSQQQGETLLTVTDVWPADMWPCSWTAATAALAVQNVANAPSGGRRIRFTVTTAKAALGVNDFFGAFHLIEGIDITPFRWGFADAKTLTLRIGVKAPAGTYGIAVRNATSSHNFVEQFTISAGEANTDVVKYITIPGPTVGTWDTSNGTGLRLSIVWALGTNLARAQTGAWTTGHVYGPTGVTNGIASTSNVFELFDVGLYIGSGITPAFVLPEYQAVLDKCRRYFQVQTVSIRFQAAALGHVAAHTIALPTAMRAAFTTALVVTGGRQLVSSFNFYAVDYTGGRAELAASAAGDSYVLGEVYHCFSRLP